MKPTQLDLLLLVAEEGGTGGGAALTTVAAAARLGVSQQTASRWVRELATEGMLEKTHAGLRLTAGAIKRLERLKAVFDRKPAVTFEGVVVEGMKDGAYYMALEGYKKQFKHHLGYEPFAGTLNLRLDDAKDIAARTALDSRSGIPIESFKMGERFFGGAKCFPCKVNGKVDGAIIIPLRTHHDIKIVEVIAPMKLRDKLRLKTGEAVVLEVKA
jgi:riboflavin kinase